MIKTGHVALLIALIGLGGLGLALQGWRARVPDVDVMSSMVRTVALVERGHIPRRGDLTDHNAFRPPGTSWLMVPGVWLFADPRLVELSGSGLLYLATLPGVFLIGRHLFSLPIALFATLLYAVSAIAINFAALLSPKAHPFFCIWMIYCAVLWVSRRDGRWLAAAVVLWTAGMYVHIEMAPFALMLPALWWITRAPLNARALTLAASLAVVMWSPYLLFQWERGFVDLESQLLLRRIDSRAGETVPFCGDDPQAAPQFLPRPAVGPALLERPGAMADMVLMNLETRVLGGDFLLLALLVGGVVTVFAREGTSRSPRSMRSYLWSGVVLATSIIATEFALRWVVAPGGALESMLVTVRRCHVWALIAAGVWLSADPRVAQYARVLRQSWSRCDEARAVVAAVAVPALVLLLFTEAGVPRMLGIWPVQLLLIAAFTAAGLQRLPGSSRRWILVPLLVMIVAANLTVLKRVWNWQADGWSGIEPARIAAADFRLVRCEDER